MLQCESPFKDLTVKIILLKTRDGKEYLAKEAYVGSESRALFPLTEEFATQSSNSLVGLRGEAKVIEVILSLSFRSLPSPHSPLPPPPKHKRIRKRMRDLTMNATRLFYRNTAVPYSGIYTIT